MQCYNCGNELTKSDRCPYCNIDVSAYKRLILKSYKLYNEALEMAKLRNISGAIRNLEEALKIDKTFIEARNLLGLCYFEIGELVSALKEWIISTSLKKDDNKAKEYLEKIRLNKSKLDSMNNVTRRYNLALRDCMENKPDVAVIQLKRVINFNLMHILKAYQLLGLIYINNGDYKKAKDVLYQALEIDHYNHITLLYLKEAEDAIASKNSSKKRKKQEPKIKNILAEKEKEEDAEESKPEYFSYVNYKEGNTVVSVVNLIIGILVGALLIWFLVIPAKEQQIKSKNNAEMNRLSEVVSLKENEITTLESDLAKLKKKMKSSDDNANGQADRIKNTTNLLSAYKALRDRNNEEALKYINKIDPEKLSEEEKPVYYDISRTVHEADIRILQRNGSNELRNGNYNNAIENFRQLLSYDPMNDEASYNIAQAYLRKDEKAEAKKYLESYLEKFPSGKYSNTVKREIDRINSELDIGG